MPDSGAVEYAYALMAAEAGIEMSETRLFQTKENDLFFGIKRFDRKENRRFHIHTLGNLLHADFRIPSLDYEDFLKVIRVLTKNHQDTLKGFRQMVFNVLTNNRDDHVKNFAFALDEHQQWHLTPAYDLTFSPGPGGEHSMALLGEGRSPGKREMLELGKRADLSIKEITACIDQVRFSANKWKEYARQAGVSKKSTEYINFHILEKLKLC